MQKYLVGRKNRNFFLASDVFSVLFFWLWSAAIFKFTFLAVQNPNFEIRPVIKADSKSSTLKITSSNTKEIAHSKKDAMEVAMPAQAANLQMDRGRPSSRENSDASKQRTQSLGRLEHWVTFFRFRNFSHSSAFPLLYGFQPFFRSCNIDLYSYAGHFLIWNEGENKSMRKKRFWYMARFAFFACWEIKNRGSVEKFQRWFNFASVEVFSRNQDFCVMMRKWGRRSGEGWR